MYRVSQIRFTSFLLNQFYKLQFYKLQENVEKLNYIMGQYTDMLDSIAHKQVVIDCLTRLQNFLSHRFSMAHHKLNDIIQLGSLTCSQGCPVIAVE